MTSLHDVIWGGIYIFMTGIRQIKWLQLKSELQGIKIQGDFENWIWKPYSENVECYLLV